MDFKSFLIGFLLAACVFMLMGNSNVNWGSLQGRYQLAVSDNAWGILDTQTGKAQIMNKGKPIIMEYSK